MFFLRSKLYCASGFGAHGYYPKYSQGKKKKKGDFLEGIITREYAHAKGELSIFVEVSVVDEELLSGILQSIPYWGQTDSLAICIGISHCSPDPALCGKPMNNEWDGSSKSKYISLVMEMSPQVEWTELLNQTDMAPSWLIPTYFLWPMEVKQQTGFGKLLA